MDGEESGGEKARLVTARVSFSPCQPDRDVSASTPVQKGESWRGVEPKIANGGRGSRR
jgi:hypothetical protein